MANRQGEVDCVRASLRPQLTLWFDLAWSQHSSWTAWSLKMAPIVCPETLVANYQSTLRKIPEEPSHNVVCVVQVKLCVLCLFLHYRRRHYNFKCTLFIPPIYDCFFCTIPEQHNDAFFQLGTSVKFSSRYVSGPCVSTRSRTAISTYSLWDVPVYSLVHSSAGLCRWDATNGIILTVQFVHRLWFKMKIETLRFGYDRSPSSGIEKALRTSGQPMPFHLVRCTAKPIVARDYRAV